MSEYARASVIVPILLRCWLRKYHIRKKYSNALIRKYQTRMKNENLEICNVVVMNLIKIVKNNNIVAAIKFIKQN